MATAPTGASSRPGPRPRKAARGAATLGGDRVEISGGYPWADGPITVKATLTAPCKIRLRIPRWTAAPSVEKLKVEKLKVDGGWIEVEGRAGDGASPSRAAVRCGDGASPSRDDGGVVATSNANSRWLEVEGRAGENAWLLRFDMSPRLVEWTAPAEEDLPPSPQEDHDEIPDYTVHFMEWYTPEMANLARREPAMRVLRGPLVLAKGRLAGTSREETLFASSLRGQGWRAAALVSSCVVWFENAAPKDTVRFTTGADMGNPDMDESIPVGLLQKSEKWPPIILGSDFDEPKVGDWFSIRRGIATGDNTFFILPEDAVVRHGFPTEFLPPSSAEPDDATAADFRKWNRVNWEV